MEATQLAQFKDLLMASRAELAERLAELRDEKIKHQTRDSSENHTTYSDHPADIGSDLYERERIAESVNALNRQLLEFDEALYRLLHGNYGICEKCSKPISVERLLNRPSTRYCLECQTKLEKATSGKR
jgi:DnaK suppressor protein